MKLTFTRQLFLGAATLTAAGCFIHTFTPSVARAQTQGQPPGHYTVHEWGTFTSVQGGDGELLRWQPLKSPELPGFVHDWYRPGLKVVPQHLAPGGKGGMVTLQRMETPVIYFYSDQTMQAGVSVGFPQGIITEWYPHPAQIGPAEITPAIDRNASLTESRVTWRDLTLVPAAQAGPALAAQVPTDQAGRNY